MRLIDADRINFYKATVARGMHSFENVEIVEKFQINRMPTIDPESLRPHGEWVLIPPTVPFETYKCSLCGAKVVYAAPNYCPICGAKMEVDDEQ